MKNEIVKTNVNFNEVSKLNQFARLKQFAKQNNISNEAFPTMYMS